MTAMNQSALVTLPDGQVINTTQLSTITPNYSAFTIAFVVGASTITYKGASYLEIKSVLEQFGSGIRNIAPGGAYTMSSISPSIFDFTITTLTIKGSSFVSASVGKLHIEDQGGGPDSNGYYMNCTFVDENTLTAVYGGPGDAGVGSTMMLYYEDTLGNRSNALFADNPALNTTLYMH